MCPSSSCRMRSVDREPSGLSHEVEQCNLYCEGMCVHVVSIAECNRGCILHIWLERLRTRHRGPVGAAYIIPVPDAVARHLQFTAAVWTSRASCD